MVVGTVVAVGAYLAAHELVPTGFFIIRIAAFVLIFIPAWAVVELPVTWYLRHRYELDVVDRKTE